MPDHPHGPRGRCRCSSSTALTSVVGVLRLLPPALLPPGPTLCSPLQPLGGHSHRVGPLSVLPRVYGVPGPHSVLGLQSPARIPPVLEGGEEGFTRKAWWGTQPRGKHPAWAARRAVGAHSRAIAVLLGMRARVCVPAGEGPCAAHTRTHACAHTQRVSEEAFGRTGVSCVPGVAVS